MSSWLIVGRPSPLSDYASSIAHPLAALLRALGGAVRAAAALGLRHVNLLPLNRRLGRGPALRDLGAHTDVDGLLGNALAAELGGHHCPTLGAVVVGLPRAPLGVRTPLIADGVRLGAGLCDLLRGGLRGADLCRLPVELRLCAGVLGELTELVRGAVRGAAGVGLGVVLARLELELGGAIGAAGIGGSVRLDGDRLTVVALASLGLNRAGSLSGFSTIEGDDVTVEAPVQVL